MNIFKMIKPLEYHFDDGSHVIFNNYTIDTSGVIRNKLALETMVSMMGKNSANEVCLVH
jgi:hypothetical protein